MTHCSNMVLNRRLCIRNGPAGREERQVRTACGSGRVLSVRSFTRPLPQAVLTGTSAIAPLPFHIRISSSQAAKSTEAQYLPGLTEEFVIHLKILF